MSREQLIEKIKDLPEECFDKLSTYIDSLKDSKPKAKNNCFEELCKLRGTMELDKDAIIKTRELSKIWNY